MKRDELKQGGKLRGFSLVGAAAAMALTGVLATNVPANADPDKVAAAQKQLAALEEKGTRIASDYRNLTEKLATANAKLTRLDKEQKSQQADINKVKASFGQLAMMQYQTSGVDATARLLAAPDDTAFLSQLTTVQSASTMVNQRVQDYQTKAAKLNSTKAQAAEARNEIASATAQQKTLMAQSQKSTDDAKKTLDRLSKEEKDRLEKVKAEAIKKQQAAALAQDNQPASRSNDKKKSSSGGDSKGNPSTPPPAVSGDKAQTAINFAMSKVGGGYVMGGNGPTNYDCSGLTSAAWAAAGVSLTRTSQSQFNEGVSVSRSQLQPGDLVFYYSGITHVALYIGNGKIVHAANPSSGIKTDSVDTMPFAGARRVG